MFANLTILLYCLAFYSAIQYASALPDLPSDPLILLPVRHRRFVVDENAGHFRKGPLITPTKSPFNPNPPQPFQTSGSKGFRFRRFVDRNSQPPVFSRPGASSVVTLPPFRPSLDRQQEKFMF